MDPPALTIANSADVDARASIEQDTTIWHLAQVREFATIGAGCIIGRGVYVDAGVSVGDHCKLQNYALVYAPSELGDGVFIGPGAILTNDVYPRSITPEGRQKDADDWDAKGTVVGRGASIGARAVVLAGVEIGPWALIAAGAIVTRAVPAHALCVGMPARQTGWVGFAGVPLEPADGGTLRCPEEGRHFRIEDDQLKALA